MKLQLQFYLKHTKKQIQKKNKVTTHYMYTLADDELWTNQVFISNKFTVKQFDFV